MQATLPKQTITARALYALREKGEDITVVDVRTPAEFGEVHLAGAKCVPLATFDPAVLSTGTPEESIYLMCRTGARSQKAYERCRAAEVHNVLVVEGGLDAWEDAGLPVQRGKKSVSLERQVRIAAGTLVLLGAVLGLTVAPAFTILSALVGAGLVFAGITDTCGMGLLLARMPWNQKG